ncbi:MAG: helix-turn-helix transcriptional regulator [Betaproteobacteria bacterium]|nr:helix-turn-helix transcriptional regulator [Betaproteobacteria bacterium]
MPTLVWRTNRQLADAVRAAREAAGLTQARLAARARVGLKFLYELESGKDTLRTDKVLDVLDVLGLRLLVTPASAAVREPEARFDVARDFIGMACTSASVSLRAALSPDELVKALLTGKPTPGRRAHFAVLLEEAPAELLRGLVAQVGRWATPGQVAANLKKIAAEVGVRTRPGT